MTRLIVAYFGFAVTGLLLILAWLLLQNIFSPPYAPFGEFPEQQVTDRIPGIAMPAIHLGAHVHTMATKCFAQDVDVDGLASIIRQGEERQAIILNQGAGHWAAGCHTISYDNILPSTVTTGTWQIEGYNHAQRADGKDAYVFFHSQIFIIVY